MEVYLLETYDGKFTYEDILFHQKETGAWYVTDGDDGNIYRISFDEILFENYSIHYNLTYLGKV